MTARAATDNIPANDTGTSSHPAQGHGDAVGAGELQAYLRDVYIRASYNMPVLYLPYVLDSDRTGHITACSTAHPVAELTVDGLQSPIRWCRCVRDSTVRHSGILAAVGFPVGGDDRFAALSAHRILRRGGPYVGRDRQGCTPEPTLDLSTDVGRYHTTMIDLDRWSRIEAEHVSSPHPLYADALTELAHHYQPHLGRLRRETEQITGDNPNRQILTVRTSSYLETDIIWPHHRTPDNTLYVVYDTDFDTTDVAVLDDLEYSDAADVTAIDNIDELLPTIAQLHSDNPGRLADICNTVTALRPAS
jgi:hypothetical protein